MLKWLPHLLATLMVVGAQAPAMSAAHAAEGARWSEAQANAWFERQPWLVGSNYIPANSINQLEMWQAGTFDPKRIDLELGWAADMGMNTMRVFLHDLAWHQDPKGFKQRLETFLQISARHGIKPMLVLFDSCWDPDPKLGAQRPPIPGVHNSGWVQGPGTAALDDPKQHARLEQYVKDIVGSFGKDERVLAWDVWNEPDNEGGGSGFYQPRESKHKFDRVAELLPKVFAWARTQKPTQPLTSGLWHNPDWNKLDKLNRVEKAQIELSDVISFHTYAWPEDFEQRVRELQVYGRPLLCTEYLARGAGSTIDGVLPVAKKLNVGMYNWGFVDGKTQTRFPWDSWERPYTQKPPTLWFHDLLHGDGKPYRAREIEIIRALSKAPKNEVPAL